MRVDFFFGPGSRYSYLASTQLPRLVADLGVTFRWRAMFSGDLIERVGGPRRSPQDPAYRERDVRRWARLYGVPYVSPQGRCDWRRLALACVAAAELGGAERFASRLFEKIYGNGLAPNDEDLVALAVEVGLSESAFLAAIDSAEVTAAYENNVRDALAAGAFGVPTFVTTAGAMVWGQDRLGILGDIIRFGDVAG